MDFVKVAHKQAKTAKIEIDPYISKSLKTKKDLNFVYFPVVDLPSNLLVKFGIEKLNDIETFERKNIEFDFYFEVYPPSIFLLQKQLVEVYQALCNKFSCRFIFLKKKINHEVIRAPQTELLYPPPADVPLFESVHASIVQNGITYKWYPLHTMFCRGNIEEKIRISKLDLSQDEVILDLYAGIGYWILPLLKLQPGKIKRVIACDLNTWSIKALKENLSLNKIDEGKVTVCEGDNKQFLNVYEGLCDRVFLGLLPSSQTGWELAIQALKSNRGGYLHVHQNLAKSEVESFSSFVSLKLNELSNTYNKGFKEFIIEKVTRVKSYSPKVYHYVFDIKVC